MSVPRSPRRQAWQALPRECDVLVIGGGITGAGVALDAATRGYQVVLVERGDFAHGTSSRSTKLVHGGLRYLPQVQFDLVREALIERERLCRIAPHLVHRLPFVVPLYEDTRRPLGISIPRPLRPLAPLGLRAGLWAYDLLSHTDLGHRALDRDGAARLVPPLRVDGLRAAFLYHDAQTDDVRLTHAVLATARRHGAVTLNYAEVAEARPGMPARVLVRDRLEGGEAQVAARHVVNAAGVWAEAVAALAGGVPFRIERSKGTHLILDAPALLRAHALVIPETDDGRLAFAVPWRGRILLGTTDQSYTGDPDGVVPTAEDARYLLDHLNRYLRTPVGGDAVISGYAGLRPLVRRGRRSTARLSRSHDVVQHAGGLVSIIGGKLTTYRQMAEDTVDVLARRDGRHRPCRTRELILEGGGGTRDGIGPQARRAGLSDLQIDHLYETYGNAESPILELITSEPELARPLTAGLPVLAAEVVHACRSEYLVHVSDFLLYRSHIAELDRRHGLECADKVAHLMARELEWSPAAVGREIEEYRLAIARQLAFLDALR